MVEGYYPETLQEACTLRSTYPDSLLVSGGTDVMVVKRKAPHMIFLHKVQELKRVTEEKEAIRIGAGISYSGLLTKKQVPDVLKQAIRQIASPAVRNVGTIAGNICNASPAGDTIPVLYALSAVVVLASSNGKAVVERRLPIEEFILGIRKTALRQTELVAAVEIPKASYESMTKVSYEKVGARKSEAISKASFVGLLRANAGKVEDIRIAFGAVSVTAVRRREIEEEIKGMDLGELAKRKQDIISKYAAYIKPIDDQRSTANYRKTVCMNLLDDFLTC